MAEQELVGESVAKVTLSVQRTVSVRQYEPIQVFGSMSLGVDTSPEQVEALLGLFDQYSVILAGRVINLAEEQANELRGSAPVAPQQTAPKRQPAAARGQRQPAASVESLVVEGRQVETYIKDNGDLGAKTDCDEIGCQKRAYFGPSVNARTGVEYSAIDNLKSAVKFRGGVFCRDHSDVGKPRPAPRRAQRQVDDDSDLEF